MQASHVHGSPGILSRLIILILGVLAYAGFHVVFLTLISFVNGGPLPFEGAGVWIPSAVGRIAWNLGLVALFGVQHAIMARPAFKEVWCRVVPAAAERSLFVVATVLCLFVVILGWQTIPETLFEIDSPPLRYGLFVLQGVGWFTVVLSTFLIDHFELFGLRQVWCNLRGTELPIQKFRKPLLYRYSRHPMMVGMFLGFWATPVMTFDRLILAAAFSLYIVLGTRLEERDLAAYLGDQYRRYQEEVPRFFVFGKSKALGRS